MENRVRDIEMQVVQLKGSIEHLSDSVVKLRDIIEKLVEIKPELKGLNIVIQEIKRDEEKIQDKLELLEKDSLVFKLNLKAAEVEKDKEFRKSLLLYAAVLGTVGIWVKELIKAAMN